MNHPELAIKLATVQGSLWPTVSNAVSEACNAFVQMSSPLVTEGQVEDAVQEFAAPAALVQFGFAGRAGASQYLVIPLDTAAALAGGELESLDDEGLQELRGPLEAIVQGLCMGLGNATNEIVVASDVSLHVGRFARPAGLQPTDDLIRVQVAVSANETIGTLTWLMDAPVAHFVAGLTQPMQSAAPSTPFGNPLPPFGATPPNNGPAGGGDSHGLDILMDVPLEISVELGRTRMVVKEVVDLGVGSIVEIEKAAGEPVDILVNGRLVARGEVVVIEDNFGVRITEILNPRERLATLAA